MPGNPGLLGGLPAQVSSFIGREAELAAVRALVGGSRLVTLNGAGGAAKTRLGLQVAAGLAGGAGEGVWFADLAPVGDPDLVAVTVADVLGVRQEPGRPVLDTLVAAVGGGSLLVVLDNCEHVIGACARLAAARLRVLPPTELEARLDQRFALLTGGSRAGLARQQTLWALVDWSWELLAGAERTVLAALSVFAGGSAWPRPRRSRRVRTCPPQRSWGTWARWSTRAWCSSGTRGPARGGGGTGCSRRSGSTRPGSWTRRARRPSGPPGWRTASTTWP